MLLRQSEVKLVLYFPHFDLKAVGGGVSLAYVTVKVKVFGQRLDYESVGKMFGRIGGC